MNQDLQLGYLVIAASDVDRWARHCTELLGLAVEDDGGRLRVRMDALQQRFVIEQGERDDVGVVGLLAVDEATLERLAAGVRDAGVAVREGSAQECRDRRVRRLVAFTDPGGTAVELAIGAYHSVVPFSSPLVPGGFLTGQQGLGHAVLMVDELAPALAFWTGVLGFKLSDTSGHETPAGESNAAFLHCNRRHHSIALVQRPEHSTSTKTLLHFMIQAESMDAVGMAFDRALDAGLTITRSLGRHPNDRMFSFYATAPSGFDVEFGWGAVEVGADWSTDHYDHISAWGHRSLAGA